MSSLVHFKRFFSVTHIPHVLLKVILSFSKKNTLFSFSRFCPLCFPKISSDFPLKRIHNQFIFELIINFMSI